MKKKFYYEVLINTTLTFGLGFFSFLVNRYFALYLGKEVLGLMKFFTELFSYLNLVEIGIGSASTYALYKPLVKKDYDEISIIMNTLSSLYNKVFIIIVFGALCITPFLKYFIKNDLSDKNIYFYWILYVFGSALNYLFVKYNILFIADQKIIRTKIIYAFSTILIQTLQIGVIIFYKSFYAFIILNIFGNLIQFLCYKFYFKREYSKIYSINKKNIEIYKNLKNLFFHKIAGLIVFNTDIILISKFISLEVVAIYASYQMIIKMANGMINILLSILKPKIGNFIATNNKNNSFEYFKKLNIYFLFISLFISILTFKLINNFILIWLGRDFVLSNLTVLLMVFNLFIQCFRGILEAFKEGNGFFDDIHLPLLEAIINFVFSIILLHFIGLNGVVLGTVISNVLIIYIAKPILVFKVCFEQGIKKYIKIYFGYTVISIFSIILYYKVSENMEYIVVNHLIFWLKEACLQGVIVFCILFIVFLSNKTFRGEVSKLKRKF